jgi:hypothetical protein
MKLLSILAVIVFLISGKLLADNPPQASNCPEKADEDHASEEGLPVLSHAVLGYSPGQHINEVMLKELGYAADYYVFHDQRGSMFPAIARDLARLQECELLTALDVLYTRAEVKVFYGSFTRPGEPRGAQPSNHDKGAGLRIARELLISSKASRTTEEGERRLISNIGFWDYDLKTKKLKFIGGVRLAKSFGSTLSYASSKIS